MAGGQCAVEAADGLRPGRNTYEPMVLVRGTHAQRLVVEQWLGTTDAILAGGEHMEVMEATNY
eukprot:3127129-Alexandrium_andersonii.AAC.1